MLHDGNQVIFMIDRAEEGAPAYSEHGNPPSHLFPQIL